VDKWICGLVDRWIGGSVDRWIGGWVDGWIGGSVDRWIGGSVDRRVEQLLQTTKGFPPVSQLVVPNLPEKMKKHRSSYDGLQSKQNKQVSCKITPSMPCARP